MAQKSTKQSRCTGSSSRKSRSRGRCLPRRNGRYLRACLDFHARRGESKLRLAGYKVSAKNIRAAGRSWLVQVSLTELHSSRQCRPALPKSSARCISYVARHALRHITTVSGQSNRTLASLDTPQYLKVLQGAFRDSELAPASLTAKYAETPSGNSSSCRCRATPYNDKANARIRRRRAC